MCLGERFHIFRKSKVFVSRSLPCIVFIIFVLILSVSEFSILHMLSPLLLFIPLDMRYYTDDQFVIFERLETGGFLKEKTFLENSMSVNDAIIYRWDDIKTREAITGLTQILQFVEKTNTVVSRPFTYSKIEDILVRLRWKWRSYTCQRIIGVIRKYLLGIQRFLSKKWTQEIDFYKHLFDSTLIAIVREVESIEFRRI